MRFASNFEFSVWSLLKLNNIYKIIIRERKSNKNHANDKPFKAKEGYEFKNKRKRKQIKKKQEKVRRI